MGEVYRARDSRLDRDVAVKVLAGAALEDPAFRSRFQQEARAVAALNHPNIVTVHDVGENYIVSELVEGVTLRAAGPQPLRRVLELIAQVADALGAAHAIGIVHRDVKPENIMVTRDGRVKILDFGIAKRTGAAGMDSQTQPGLVIGTAGYMSPEQVRGAALDARSDIFSLGLVLFEMLAGRRAFTGDSPAAVMAAVLREDPPALPPTVPPPVAFLVSRCLEKDSDQRFASARDLSVTLRAFGTGSQPLPVVAAPPAARRKWLWRAATLLLVVCAAALAGWWMRQAFPREPFSFRQVTFRRGFVSSGRLTADGKQIIHSAQWEAEPMDLFSTHLATPEARSLNLRGAHLFAISPREELAVALGARFEGDNGQSGTLAVAPLHGGTPRVLLDNVAGADWDPEGKALAVVHVVSGASRIEYPIGTVLYQAPGWLADLRFSPRGDRLAFSEHPWSGDDRGWIATVDLSRHVAKLSRLWESVEGLAWTADGKRVWYAASATGAANTVYETGLRGGERVVARFPGGLHLEDLDRDGRFLFARTDDDRAEMYVQTRGEARSRPLDWLGSSFPAFLSDDGRLLLFSQYGQAGGANYVTYLLKLDGTAPMRLGEGDASSLSPDGAWAMGIVNLLPQQVVLWPTGAGATRMLPDAGLTYQQNAVWLPGGQRLLVTANKPGQGGRLWILDLSGRPPTPVSPEGVSLEGNALSPDGQMAAARSSDGAPRLYPVAGGEARAIPSVSAADRFVRWLPDGLHVVVANRAGLPVRLFEVDIRTGDRKLWAEFQPADSTGITEITQVLADRDGATIVYGQNRKIRTLYLAEPGR